MFYNEYIIRNSSAAELLLSFLRKVERGIVLWAEAAVHTEEADTPAADHSEDEAAADSEEEPPVEEEDRADRVSEGQDLADLALAGLRREDPDGEGPAGDGEVLYSREDSGALEDPDDAAAVPDVLFSFS